MTISFSSKDSGKHEAWMRRMKARSLTAKLNSYGKMGVNALAAATPVDSGVTADSWGYEIKARGNNSFTITWFNTHEVDGANIAVLLQYGHGTGTGGYVQGQDYINPAIKPVFDKIQAELFREVSS